jgi:hypothetical protein
MTIFFKGPFFFPNIHLKKTGFFRYTISHSDYRTVSPYFKTLRVDDENGYA